MLAHFDPIYSAVVMLKYGESSRSETVDGSGRLDVILHFKNVNYEKQLQFTI